MTKKKYIKEYITQISSVASSKKHTENTYYSHFENLMRQYFPDDKFIVRSNEGGKKGVPDITVYYVDLGVEKPVIRFEAKDFCKWDVKRGKYKPINIEKIIKNPSASSEAEHLREQCYKYRLDDSGGSTVLVIITDFLSCWVIDPESRNPDPKTRGHKKVKIIRKYLMCDWKEGFPTTVVETENFDLEMKHMIKFLRTYIDYTFSTAKELRFGILNFVKPDPFNKRYNLHDELKRIMTNPKRGIETKYKDYLEQMNNDFNNSLFKDTPRNERMQFVDLYTQLIVYSIFMCWSKYNTTEQDEREEEFTILNIVDNLPYDSLISNLIRIDRMPKKLREGIIHPLEHCFRKSNYHEIMKDIKNVYGQFYSDFLREFNKKVAEDMGVVNTPAEIISFIVRGTDYFLQNREWSIEGRITKTSRGIMDKRVCFLDPASGTMGFSVLMMKLVKEKIERKIKSTPKYKGLTKKELEERSKEKFNEWIFEKIRPPSYLRKNEREQYLNNQPFFLENVFAFEVLISPYVLGYLRMLAEAEQLGAKIDYNLHRPQLFLTNSLMNKPEELPFTEMDKVDWDELSRRDRNSLRSYLKIENSALKTEIATSLRIRHDTDIMVIWGNPPYNVSTQNNTPWITRLTGEYTDPEIMRREKGKPQIKPITGLKAMQGDALKFHRFAQWKITENNRQGIVSYVSNCYFIDGKAARGMRKVLRTVYDEIWVVNLFGNKEKGVPQRIKDQGFPIDENIFPRGCTRSIAITFMIRYPEEKHLENKKDNEINCKVFYVEKSGYRKNEYSNGEPIQDKNYFDGEEKLIPGKFEWLESNDIESIKWEEVGDRLDHEFVPLFDGREKEELYNSFPYIGGIFLQSLVGIVTGQDTLVSNIDKERLKENLRRFYTREFNESLVDFSYVDHNKKRTQGKKYKDNELDFNDNRDWKISEALKSDPIKANKRIMKWLWRGFDYRYISYYRPLIKRGTDQYGIMQFLFPEMNNIAICLDRGIHCGAKSNIAMVSRNIVEHKATSYSTGKGTAAFPLKINVTEEREDHPDRPKDPIDYNINPKFKKMLQYKVNDESIFYYIYGILYTEKFREEFFEFLKGEYPNIPFPKQKNYFFQISHYGRRLAKMHLLLENEEKEKIETSSPIYKLLNSGIDDELRLSDTDYNKKNNESEDRKLKRVWYEGDEIDPKTKKLISQKDIKGNWVSFKIYFDKPKKTNRDILFWIDGITRPIWDFEIGGRKQIYEWMLKRRYTNPETPRKNYITHELRHNNEEIEYLRLMISAIKRTLEIQEELGKVYLVMKDDFISFKLKKLNLLLEKKKGKKLKKMKHSTLV